MHNYAKNICRHCGMEWCYDCAPYGTQCPDCGADQFDCNGDRTSLLPGSKPGTIMIWSQAKNRLLEKPFHSRHTHTHTPVTCHHCGRVHCLDCSDGDECPDCHF